MAEGAVFEQAGVSFSHVPVRRSRPRPPPAGRTSAESASPPSGSRSSSTRRTPTPHHPHLNVRYFRRRKARLAGRPGGSGSGFDLTPFYPFEEECRPLAHRGARPLPTLRRGRLTRGSSAGATVLLPAHRASRAAWGALFFDDSPSGGSSAASPSSARWATASSAPICRSSSAARVLRTASASAIFNSTAAALHRVQLLYDRGNPSSACSPVGAPESILMSLPRRSVSATTGGRAGAPRGTALTRSSSTHARMIPRWTPLSQ